MEHLYEKASASAAWLKERLGETAAVAKKNVATACGA